MAMWEANEPADDPFSGAAMPFVVCQTLNQPRSILLNTDPQ